MNEQQNIEVVKKGYEAFGTGNIPALLDLFDENIQWRSPKVEGSPFEEEYNGREAVGDFSKRSAKVKLSAISSPRNLSLRMIKLSFLAK